MSVSRRYNVGILSVSTAGLEAGGPLVDTGMYRMFGATRVKQLLRKYRYYLLALLAAAGLAANLPESWLIGQSGEARRSEVISEFLNLSVDPGAGGMAGVRMDWLVQSRQLRERREERLEHVPPALLAAYAARMEMTEPALREVLTDAERADPFELSGFEFGHVDDIDYGAADPWHWGLVRSEAEDEVTEPGLEMGGCGIWLVFWTETEWFYAPVGSAELNDPLAEAVPELAGVAPEGVDRC
ncbi:hypothetical protein [Roseovarius indicus]|uniref:hypothetical protein n=2 Tax=Roseovarius indicus TaxID=540747 RepID=UPI0010FF5C46|nr:hypothetical protein [Roseovarius indicus]